LKFDFLPNFCYNKYRKRKEKLSMFIKILTPNHNGKIELTVADLEALIQEAVDKAIREDRANRPYNTWYSGNTLLNQNPPVEVTLTKKTDPMWDWSKVTCGSYEAPSESSLATNINRLIGE
jgi:hypothetical protein